MSQKFYPGIHALRGIAAVCVLVQHAIVLPLLAAKVDIASVLKFDPSYFGVLLFFCLSGFVIGTNRALPTKEFAWRRVLRIYPAYWVACIIALLLAKFGGPPATIDSWTLFLLPADHLIGLTVAYWTLVYEVFFYALATLVFAMRISDKTLTVIIIGWMILIHICSGYVTDLNIAWPGWWIAVSRYNQFFAVGVLCAIHFDRLKSITTETYMVVALLALSASQLAGIHAGASHSLLYAIFLASLIMASIRVVRIPRFLFTLGESSYGIYLTHYFVILSLIPIGESLGFRLRTIMLVGGFAGLAVGIGFGLLEARLYKRVTKLIWPRPSTGDQKTAPVLSSAESPLS